MRRWYVVLALGALVFASDVRSALAHGPLSSVHDVGARRADDSPWLLALSRGLVIEQSEGWSFVCPQAFEDNDWLSVIADADAAWVAAPGGRYRVDPDGTIERLGELAVTQDQLIAADMIGGAPRAVAATETQTVLLDHATGAVAVLDDAPWMSGTAAGDAMWVARLDEGVTTLARVVEGPEGVEGATLESVAIPTPEISEFVRLHGLGDDLYLLGQDTETEGVVARLGRVDGDAVTWFGTVSPRYSGPAIIDGRVWFHDNGYVWWVEEDTLSLGRILDVTKVGGEPAWAATFRTLIEYQGSLDDERVLFDLADIVSWSTSGGDAASEARCVESGVGLGRQVELASPDAGADAGALDAAVDADASAGVPGDAGAPTSSSGCSHGPASRRESALAWLGLGLAAFVRRRRARRVAAGHA